MYPDVIEAETGTGEDSVLENRNILGRLQSFAKFLTQSDKR